MKTPPKHPLMLVFDLALAATVIYQIVAILKQPQPGAVNVTTNTADKPGQ